MPALKWTAELIKVEAIKYSTRREWRKGSCSSYDAARVRFGSTFFEECCQHMQYVRTYWDKEAIFAEAKKHDLRSTWKAMSQGSYFAAKQISEQFFIDCCTHMRDGIKEKKSKYTHEALLADAAKYETKTHWLNNSRNMYRAAAKISGEFFDLCCSHMQALFVTWAEDSLLAIAQKYSARIDWQREDNKSYQAARARSNEFFEQCCEHMKRPVADNDTVYLWKAKGVFFNGMPVFKVGVTSEKFGTKRIEQVAAEFGVEYEILALTKVNGKATAIESQMLAIGINPKLVSFAGSTEFRAMDEQQVAQTINLMTQHQSV